MAELFYRKLTGLPGDESPVVMVTTGGSGGGVVDMRLVVWGWEAPPPGTFSKRYWGWGEYISLNNINGGLLIANRIRHSSSHV